MTHANCDILPLFQLWFSHNLAANVILTTKIQLLTASGLLLTQDYSRIVVVLKLF
jgi:hypothetical protein